MVNKLIIMCGAPGCGKSTYAKEYCKKYPETVYVSRDEIRFSLLAEDEYYFSHETEVLEKFYTNIANALREGKDVIADATHLTKKSRKTCIDNIRAKIKNLTFGIEVIYIKPPLHICIARNDKRTGRAFVPHSSIRRMWMCMEDPTNDGMKYSRIIYIKE